MRMIASTLLASIFMVSQASAEKVWLTMDQVFPFDLKDAAVSVVVGNPGIADVTVIDNKRLLLFGKAPGVTNVYIFDEDGGTIKNLTLNVRTPSSDMMVVHRGSERSTYNCTINCEATLTVGDAATTFNTVNQQVGQKFGQAAGSQ
ncbi:MAG: pilus assembly protein N-terminal domain-containing protein [Pseudomonadota bacterium]